MKHLGKMNNNTLAKQALVLLEELRNKKQVCFPSNIDKILKSYDINSTIDDFQFLPSPTIKQYVTKMKTSYVNLWQANKQNTRKFVFYNTFKKDFKPDVYRSRPNFKSKLVVIELIKFLGQIVSANHAN